MRPEQTSEGIDAVLQGHAPPWWHIEKDMPRAVVWWLITATRKECEKQKRAVAPMRCPPWFGVDYNRPTASGPPRTRSRRDGGPSVEPPRPHAHGAGVPNAPAPTHMRGHPTGDNHRSRRTAGQADL